MNAKKFKCLNYLLVITCKLLWCNQKFPFAHWFSSPLQPLEKFIEKMFSMYKT